MRESQQEPTTGKLSLRPVGEYVYVEQQQWSGKTAGGLHMPDGVREGFSDIGTIRAVGTRVPAHLGLEAGMKVVFKRRAASALTPDWREGDPDGLKDTLRLLPEDILGEVED